MPTTHKAAKDQEREEAIARLREWVKPGDTIYTILRHCSSSGMSRVIQLVKIEHNEPMFLGYNVAKAIDERYDRDREGVKVGGAGMDMGWHLVYTLSYTLFNEGFGCIGEHCPSNDHFNGDRDHTPHATQYTADTCPGKPCSAECDHKSGDGADHWHKSGGYSLRHRWL